jgi:chromosome segregation ATPase
MEATVAVTYEARSSTGVLMEKGTFHDLDDLKELSLNKLDFLQDGTAEENLSSLRHDLRKTSAVESLLSQNEDLMARLKVALRRLSLTEEDLRTLGENHDALKTTHSALADQMLVWKEKERLWKEKHERLEKELHVLKARFPEFQSMEEKIERLTRYREKMRAVMKPYLKQLKDYAQSLHQQLLAQNQELEKREADILSQEKTIQALHEQMEHQGRFFQINQNDLTAAFERERAEFSREISALTETNSVLVSKVQILDRTLERLDELENAVIALRRKKEEQEQEFAELSEKSRAQTSDLRQTTATQELEIADLKKSLESWKASAQAAESRRNELEEQLASLRYMWNSKCEETEKLKVSLQSLEKINLDLSQKLNESRKGQV